MITFIRHVICGGNTTTNKQTNKKSLHRLGEERLILTVPNSLSAGYPGFIILSHHCEHKHDGATSSTVPYGTVTRMGGERPADAPIGTSPEYGREHQTSCKYE